MSDWPPAAGEMAARIRAHEWGATPLGPIARWPERLRVVVEMMLASPLVSSVACGPSRVLIYNDAAAALYGDRHPDALGRALSRSFPDSFPTVAGLYDRVDAGESVHVPAQPLDLGGATVFDAYLTPVRDAAGAVIAVHMMGFEIGDRLRAEAALRSSEAQYRHLFDAIDEGFCIVEVLFDPDARPLDYRFVSVNAAFERQTGLTDATGRRMRDLAPGHEAHWFETYGRIAATGVAERFEDRAEALGRWYEVFAFRVGAPEQRQVGILFKDIRARKHGEAALLESEARFRAFVTASADVVYRMSPDWSEMRGLAGRGFLADTAEPDATWLEHYVHADDRPGVCAAIARAIGGATTFELEHRVRRADGGLGWVHSRAVPILDADGAVVEWFGAASDVTQRRATQEALRESEARFRGLVEGFGQAVWEADARGAIAADSPSWRAYTGQSRDEWLEYGWLDAIHPEDRAATERTWRETVAAGRPVDAEYRLWHAAGGAWRWSNVRAVPIAGPDGRVRKWAGMNIDVTEQHEIRARQAVLVAELQHRTRNLLGVVRALSDQTLARSGDLAEFREQFGRRLAALARVQGLLSRLDAWDRVSFDALLRTELAVLGGEARAISLDGPEGVALRSSTVQTFALALHELTTNALKYGALAQPQGRLAIRWRVRRAPHGGGPWLHVDWRESGVRMPPPGKASRSGAGRALIEAALPYQLGAKTTYLMECDGVHCTIALPVSERGEASESPDV